MINIERAMQCPSDFFSKPADVLTAAGLEKAQRIEILRQWEYDMRLQQVATEENMDSAGSESANAGNALQEIHKALSDLGAGLETTSGGSKLG